MKFPVAILFLSLTSAYAGLFGPTNYEECVLDGLKNATNSSSTQLLHKVCKEKFQKDGAKSIVSECSATWNGNMFVAGRPENTEKYTQVTFRGTADSLFIPTKMMDGVTRSFILKEKNKIKSICPAINFETE